MRTVRGEHYRLEFGSGHKSANYFIERLATQLPWIQVGYYSKLDDHWSANQKQFIEEVLQQRPGYRGTPRPSA